MKKTDAKNSGRNLTPAQLAEYMANPFSCPFCGSGSLDTDEAMEPHHGSGDGVSYYRIEVSCLHCPERWEDVYRLVGIAPLEDREATQ
ncbi:MAG TPA: hypothetical protein VGN17_26205 [Bryobacteraceae bacterium]|jgi:hypothetical protein